MILIKDKLPLVATDVEAIQQAVGMVLKTANVIKVSIDARTKMVDFWRIPNEQESESIEVAHPFRIKLKEVQMEEYDVDLSPHEQLFEMFDMLEDAGCYPVFILTGRTLPNLRKWIKFPRKSSRMAGIPVTVDPDLPEDNLLVCGAPIRDAEPIDVEYVVKFTLP